MDKNELSLVRKMNEDPMMRTEVITGLLSTIDDLKEKIAHTRRATLEEVLDKMSNASISSYRAVERMIDMVRGLLDATPREKAVDGK